MTDKLNYKVGMIGALDMLRFKNMPKVREKAIQAASSAPLPKTLTTNEKAKQRHPEKQEVVVAEIRRNGADAKTIVLKTEDGSALAPFRAGQYISVCVPIGRHRDHALIFTLLVPGVDKTRRIQHYRQARRRRLCQPVHSGSLGRRAARHYLRPAGSPLL